MKVRNLTKIYRLKKGKRVEALKGVSFDLPERGMIFILGKSGSGKSTLLQLLGGMERADGGEILFGEKRLDEADNKELEAYRRNSCGFVFQEYNLIPELTAGENVDIALRLQGEKETRERTERALARVGLEGYAGRKVTELSGGERQRVAIARAIVKEPDIIFADEPTGALDEDTGGEIFELLKELSREKLVVAVTHDRGKAERYGDRIIELAHGEIVRDSGDTGGPGEGLPQGQGEGKSVLPSSTAMKIGATSFRNHPVRTVFTLLLSVIAFALSGFAFTAGRMDSAAVTFRLMREQSLSGSAVYKIYDETGGTGRFTEEDAAFIGGRPGLRTIPAVYADIEIGNLAKAGEGIYYSVLPVGFAAAAGADEAFPVQGSLPEGNREVGITRFVAEVLLHNGLIGDAGETVGAEDLLGAPLVLDGEKYCISAVIDTGFDGERYASLKSGADGGQGTLAGQFFSEVRQSAHALLFLSGTEEFVRRDEIHTNLASLDFGASRPMRTDVLKRAGEERIVGLPGASGDLYLPVSALAELLRGILCDKVYDGERCGNLWTLFQKLFAGYFSENAAEYYRLAAEEGYAGSMDEYTAAVVGGEAVPFGKSLQEIYLDVYEAYVSEFALPEAPECVLTDEVSGRRYSLSAAGFYAGKPEENEILLSAARFEEIYAEIGGMYDFIAVGAANDRRETTGLLAGKSGNGVTFVMENYLKEAVSGSEETIVRIGEAAGIIAVALTVFSAVLYLNFLGQSTRDKYATIAILRALGCGKRGVLKIFSCICGIFGGAVFVLSCLGLTAAIALADTALLAPDGVVFAVTALEIAAFSAVGSAVPAWASTDKKLLKLIAEE